MLSLYHTHEVNQTKRTRLLNIDFVRITAMLSMILYHVSAPYIIIESRFALFGQNLAFYTNQFTRFAVPLFLMLSGYCLGIGRKTSSISYLTFQKSKLPHILAPYLIWTLVYDAIGIIFENEQQLSDPNTLRRLCHELLTGNAAPHLYFIIILAQLYILYPFLVNMVDRKPLKTLVFAFALSGLFQLVFYLENQTILSDFAVQIIPRIFPYWIFYFVIGMVFERIPHKRFIAICKRNAAALILSSTMSVLAVTIITALTDNMDLTRFGMMLVVPMVFLGTSALWECIQNNCLVRIIEFLSVPSMEIYFCHVAILCSLRYIDRTSDGLSGMPILYIATITVSTLAGWGIHSLTRCLAKKMNILKTQYKS